ncbi:integrin beta-1-binding protein 1-like [Pomacea canaliculata]|uniref:integrin beta-1-binding protein 1-like n=1 Tax=Pomacea canaliculata TaxID=400727 RepID=UPI000D7258C2|nr:integrin beta-1-binding protein 1-like [Pomacea canaliculata]
MFKKVKTRNAPTGTSEDTQMSESSTENLTKDGKETVDRILHQKVHFKLFYVGSVVEISGLNSTRRDTEAQLVDYIEEKQIEGKLKLLVSEDDKVIINVSRYGIKVLDTSGQEVMQRHPLHTISQLIHYTDGFGKPNIALKIGQVGKTVFNCYVFQCHTEDQAQAICQCVRRIFDAITAKS